MILARVAHVGALLVMPFLLTGVINRVKAWWSGRKGPPLLQSAFDVVRLLKKQSVYSTTTTLLFRLAPWVFLLTAVASAVVVPLLGAAPLFSCAFDFVWFAYVWGLGRVFLLLAALDTGSSFEGMGAAREATFSTLLEPSWFLIAGALALVSGTSTLHEALAPELGSGSAVVVWAAAIVVLFIVLQTETARLPVDDPSTHLELTMVHEVMVLDHSGPELAAIQTGAAIKLLVGASLIATLMNPWAGESSLRSAAANLIGCVVVAVVVGTVESLIARFRLRAVPQYIVVAAAAGAVALLATAWRAGGAP